MLISCSKGVHIAKNIAKSLKEDYSEIKFRKFPDGELYIKLQKDVKGKHVILVQSFYGDISDCIMEVIFAANTAKSLGAKKVTLIAPHFPYHRQDKSFHSGESVSIHSMGKLMDRTVDEIVIMDPHLHRIDSLSKIFKIPSVKVTANDTIADYIKKNIKNAAIVGPDWESFKWAEYIGKKIGCEYHILHKKRWSSHKVKIYFRKGVELKGKKVVIIDDIISSGHTILETIKQLRSIGIQDISVICVHGIFAEGCLPKLQKTGAKILSCNTIPSSVSKIDVSEAFAKAIL